MPINETRFLGNPVVSLQAMLRELSFYYKDFPRIIDDGIFGPATQEAVAAFQRKFGLPVTGIVDNPTWDAIVLAFNQVRKHTAPPLLTHALPDNAYTISPGQRSVYLLMIQSMFLALAQVLEEVEAPPVSGLNTLPSAQNVRWLQRKSRLPENGVFGNQEWDMLTRLYSVFLLLVPSTDGGSSPEEE